MNAKKLAIAALGLILLLAPVACNFPGVARPAPALLSTQDMTMTAVFSTLEPGQTSVPNTGGQIPVATSTSSAIAQASTPAPTQTSANPTATNTANPAPSRANEELNATYVSSPLPIDGDLSKWKLPSYPVQWIVYHPNLWTGPSDLSANVMVGWDNQNLYIGAHVNDNIYVQRETGDQIFLGDSLEILFDTNLAGDLKDNKMSDDDYQLGISPGSPNPGANPFLYLWYPQYVAGDRPEAKVAARAVTGGYEVEAAIPWMVLNLQPQAGAYYGFAFSVSDNDLPGQSVQQKMISTVQKRYLTDPTTWGELLLNKP